MLSHPPSDYLELYATLLCGPNMQAGSDRHAEFTAALAESENWSVNYLKVNVALDKWCFSQEVDKDHLLAAPQFDSSYLRHRESVSELEYQKISFTQLVMVQFFWRLSKPLFVFSDTFRAALNTRLSYDVACNCKI